MRGFLKFLIKKSTMASDQALNFINVFKFMPIKKKKGCIVFVIFYSKYTSVGFNYNCLLSFLRNALQISIHILAYLVLKKKKRHLGGKYIELFFFFKWPINQKREKSNSIEP